MKILDKSFFEKSTIEIAKELLGKYIVCVSSGVEMIGKIVETEAYLHNDPASHSFCGKTKRNSQMFEEAGSAYVYFTYGMYYCFNVVTSDSGIGEAVLIRAVEPVRGIEKMRRNRGLTEEKNLTNGPARFTMAFGIEKDFNGINLLDKNSVIKLMEGEKEEIEIVQDERIGISKGQELPHRFYIRGNPYVSKLFSKQFKDCHKQKAKTKT
jgi:DNA-3-methyladenine glycosylase